MDLKASHLWSRAFFAVLTVMMAVGPCLRIWRIGIVSLLLAAPWVLIGCGQNATSNQLPQTSQRDSVGPLRGDQPALPAIRPSRFLNTSADVTYVGSAQCIPCHEDANRTYLESTHSRALQSIDAAYEPKEGAFHQAESGRSYRAELIDGQVWHRECLKTIGGEEIELAAYPMHYAIGSGQHSRSFLAVIEGFLIESPLTWYRAADRWELSPGFLHAEHASFERMADSGCLVCHAGRVEEEGGNRFRPRVLEPVIGCEACHGPGQIHLQKHAGERLSSEVGEDLSIVNPRHLSRDESEAICAQCHLRGNATVAVRGRKISDFRPSLQLSDFRVDYFAEDPNGDMTVVGHVEQMWRSRCYQQTSDLTCITCHNPHQPLSESAQLAWQRGRCLSCHTEKACGLNELERQTKQPDDNCMACHMPRGRTDIPHFAFTHHRIGIHPETEPAAPSAPNPSRPSGKLQPSADLAHLSSADQTRLLGLAQFEWADKQSHSAVRARFQQRAEADLRSTVNAGLADTAVHVALARLAWERQDRSRAMELAERALRGVPETERDVNALFILGDSYLQSDRPDLALPLFQQLVRLRRVSVDWSLLGYCQQRQGNLAAAWDAFRQANSIAPGAPELLEQLVHLSQLRRDPTSEARYRQLLRAVQERSPLTAPQGPMTIAP